MNKVYLKTILLIILVNGVHLEMVFPNVFMNIKAYKEPEIINKNILRLVKLGDIEQPVDHFDASVNATFKMRYYENDYYFKAGGPIIIFLGGEWAISPNTLQAGLVHDVAKDQNGIMFYTEHRYYGLSRPTEDLSSTNLRHLNVDQALADVAFFIENVKEKSLYKNSTVIVIGGSYSANMATWMRLKYPHLVNGALSSSGPIYAKADFHEYLEVVTKVLRLHGEDCPMNVKSAFSEVSKLVQTEQGLQLLKKEFKLCNEMNSRDKSIVVLFETLTDHFKIVAQYDQPSKNSTLSGELCELMRKKSLGSPLQRLASLFKTNNQCLNVDYETIVNYYRNTSYGNPNEIYRQWIYQTCTEYGYYQTTTKGSIFGDKIDLNFYEQFCQDLFGLKYDKQLLNRRIKRTNIVYGGRDPEITNVIFTNGSKDPWHTLSRLTNLNNQSPSYFINETSHCYDLKPDNPSDSEELIRVRRQIKQDISAIIKMARINE